MRAGTVVALLVTVAAAAHADPTKVQCIDADTKAQQLKDAGKFRAAHAELDVCTLSACPPMVRQDCIERLEELSRIAPTVVFDVKDGSGADLPATTVTMDAQPLVDHLDGRAVPVDPGDHAFTFTTRGQAPHTEHVLIHEGDKERRVSVILGAPAAQEQGATGATLRIAGIAVGGVGVVGLGLAAVFTVIATSTWHTAESECNAMSCPAHDLAVQDHDAAYSLATAATVAVTVGGLLAATGLVLVVIAPRKSTKESRLRVSPLLGAVSGLVLTGAFE